MGNALFSSENQKFKMASEIGLAIEKWSLCELMIPYIASSASDNEKTPFANGETPFSVLSHIDRVLHTAINSVIGFEARMDIADNLIGESNVKKGNKILWQKISKRMRKKYKSRHQIAHFIFTEIEGKPLTISPFATSIFDDNETRLSVSEVKAKRLHYLEIYDGLVWFHRQIEVDKGRLEANPVPIPELIQRFVQEVSDQIQQERPSPAQP